MTGKTTEPLNQPSPATGENPKAPKKTRQNAWRAKDWETLFVAFIFLVALVATLWMIFVSITGNDPDNRFRIVPAASLMLIVEIWLFITLPLYSKLAFWGAVLSLATYLFFAVPFVFLGLLPDAVSLGAAIFIVISLVCGLLLYRQRDRFFPPAPLPPRTRRPAPPKA